VTSKKPSSGSRPSRAEAVADTWIIRPASAQSAKEWQAAFDDRPDPMQAERERLRTRPMDRSANPRRTAQLHGPLATRRLGGVTLPQWQHEITSSGRIWYCPDKREHVVWVTKVDLRHPKETE